VHHRQDQRWAAEDDAQYAEAQQQYVAQQAAAGDDMDEIKKLAELHAQGILTDEEFAAKKAQLLGI